MHISCPIIHPYEPTTPCDEPEECTPITINVTIPKNCEEE